MEIFKWRNTALGCFAFIISLYISNVLNNQLRYIAISATVILFDLFVLIYKMKKSNKILKLLIRYTPLVLGIFTALFISVFTFGNDEKIEKYFDKSYESVIRIKEVRHELPYESLYIATTQSIGGENYKTDIYFCTDGSAFQCGDIINANIQYSEIKYMSNDKESIFTKGIMALGYSDSYYKTGHKSYIIKDTFSDLRDFLKSNLEGAVNTETYQIICAIFLGDKSELPVNVKRDFSRVGASHILALSGMHISLIVTMIGFFLGLLRIREQNKIVLIILSTAVFVLATGMSESALRAGIMVIIFHLLKMLRFTSDTVTSLFLAVSLICFFSPYSIFSLSLILSFIALLACICSGKFIHRFKFLTKLRPKILKYIIFTIITTVTVNIFTLPVIFLYFGVFSLVSPITNVILVPIFTVILYISPFIIVFSKIAFLRIPLGFIAEKLTHFALFIIHRVASCKYSVIALKGTVETIGIILIIVSLISIIIISKRHIKFALIGTLLSICVFGTGIFYDYYGRFNKTLMGVSQYSPSSDFITVEYDNKLTVFAIGASPHLDEAYYMSEDLGYTEIENLIVFEYYRFLYDNIDKISDATYLRNLYIKHPDEDEKDAFDKISLLASSKDINLKFIEDNMIFDKISADVSIKSLPRSIKSIVSISISHNNCTATYLGASSYELLDGFAENKAYISDILVFGSYGPNYKINYKYDTPYADYFIFLGSSKDFADDDFLKSVDSKEIEYNDAPIRFILE